MWFLIGVVVGGIIVYFYWRNKEQDARNNGLALQQRLTDAENENRRLLSQQASSQQQGEQSDTYQAELRAKTEDLQQMTGQLSTAEAQIETLRGQLAEAQAKAKAAEELPHVTEQLSEAEAQIASLREQLAAETETVVQRLIPEPVEEAAPPVQPDDLKKIEGIGPKVAQVLNEDGILTFAQLAQADVSRLRAILQEAGPRFKMMEPDSWPEQASLAGKGDWDALEKLQDELDGGKYRKS